RLERLQPRDDGQDLEEDDQSRDHEDRDDDRNDGGFLLRGFGRHVRHLLRNEASLVRICFFPCVSVDFRYSRPSAPVISPSEGYAWMTLESAETGRPFFFARTTSARRSPACGCTIVAPRILPFSP